MIPILALTAHAMPEDREKYLAAGMNGYITKPVSMQAVADALAGIAFPINAGLPYTDPGSSRFVRQRRTTQDKSTPAATDPGSTTPATTVAGRAEAGLPVAAAHQDKNKTIQKTAPAVVFDSKAFAGRLSGDKALIREVIGVFLEETPPSLRALEQAVAKQRKDDAARLAHTIKGSAANIGGNQLRTVAAKIEKACYASDWHEAEAFVSRLNKQFEFLERAMREYLKKAEGRRQKALLRRSRP